MNRFFLKIMAVVGFFISAKWFASNELRPNLYGMAIGSAVTLLIDTVIFFRRERNFLQLYFNSLILNRDKEIRLSIAYLYKIECHGKYLLVRNDRFDNVAYQPVGGVYKYFHPEATDNLLKMSVIPDNAIENDRKSEFDLRSKMKNRKYLRKFLKWFYDSKEREIDPWREFHEELIEPNILPAEHFSFIYYKLVAQHFEPIKKDEHYGIDTFKYVDVYTPRFINQKQKDEVEKLLEIKSDKFIWVTEAEIRKKRSKEGKRIAPHTNKIFFNKKLN